MAQDLSPGQWYLRVARLARWQSVCLRKPTADAVSPCRAFCPGDERMPHVAAYAAFSVRVVLPCLQVYKGLLHGTTPVAIKLITRQTHKEKLRFVSEIHILKNLRHVNVGHMSVLPMFQLLWLTIVGSSNAKHPKRPFDSGLQVDEIKHMTLLGAPHILLMSLHCPAAQACRLDGLCWDMPAYAIKKGDL